MWTRGARRSTRRPSLASPSTSRRSASKTCAARAAPNPAAPTHEVRPPGGTLRIDALTLQVDGELPSTDTPWPPGFPTFSDGLHRRVPAPEGTARLNAAGLVAALHNAGWDAGHERAILENVLVRFQPGGFRWQTLDVPTTDTPCPAGAAPVERNGETGAERVCARPDGTLDGPIVGATFRGWMVDGERDRDWLSWRIGSFEIQRYRRGVPVGHWEQKGHPTSSDGHYVDGDKDGLWTVQTWDPSTGAVVEGTEWCRGLRCGSFRRQSPGGIQTGTYVDDQRQGRWQTTLGDVVVVEGDYDRGHPIGVHRHFERDGQRRAIDRYDDDGQKHGTWRQYRYGQRVSKEVWVHDTLIRRWVWTHGIRTRDRSLP